MHVTKSEAASWPLFDFYHLLPVLKGILSFPGGSDGKESACSAGDPGSIPGLGRSPGKGNGNPLQCSCLEKSMDGGAWRATAMGREESDVTERLHFLFFHLNIFI